MQGINSAHLRRAVSRGMWSPSLFRRLVMVLFFVSSVMGVSYLLQDDLRSSGAPASHKDVKDLLPGVMELSRPASSGHVIAKSLQPEAHLWRDTARITKSKTVAEIGDHPKSYRTLRLNELAQRKELSHAPLEFTKAAKRSQVVMTLPMPDGTLTRFRVEESPVMEPQLAARFPEIKTYRGRGLDDPTATTRFDVTPAGFHAIVHRRHDHYRARCAWACRQLCEL